MDFFQSHICIQTQECVGKRGIHWVTDVYVSTWTGSCEVQLLLELALGLDSVSGSLLRLKPLHDGLFEIVSMIVSRPRARQFQSS